MEDHNEIWKIYKESFPENQRIGIPVQLLIYTCPKLLETWRFCTSIN